MDNENKEIWAEYKRAQKVRRAERLPVRTEAILALKNSGFKVRRLTEFQFRVNERLDLYPIHNRYHDIKTKERGGYGGVRKFVMKFFRDNKNL